MFPILIIIFSFKFINYINYNKNNNISYTDISSSPTCALGPPSTQAGNPSAQGWADWVSSGCSLGRDLPRAQAWQPNARCPQPQRRASSLVLGVCLLQPHTCPHQTVQSIVKARTVNNTHAIVQNSIIHIEFTHSAQ
jgi:hypothetical protein